MVSVRLFGGASLEAESGALTGPAMQRHRLALLSLLATSHPGAATRDRIIAHVWPERDTEGARNLLNQAVHVLRKTLGDEAILAAGDELRLGAHAVHCDVVLFEKALASGDLTEAVSLYRGPFLDGFYLPRALEFEHWAQALRERYAHAYRATLEELAEAKTRAGDPAAAVEWWRRLVAANPHNARLTLRLMEALAAAGDRAAAIQQARVHATLLEQEFDAEPDAEVLALAERLRKERVTQDRRQGVPEASMTRSVNTNKRTSSWDRLSIEPGPTSRARSSSPAGGRRPGNCSPNWRRRPQRPASTSRPSLRH